jgi:ATP-binding cassette subfamily B protein
MTKGHFWMFVVAMFFGVGSAVGNFSLPMIVRITIDNVIGDYPLGNNFLVMWLVNLLGGIEGFRGNIWLVAAAHLIIALLLSIAIFGRQRMIALFGENTAKRMKDSLYDHIQKLPYNYHVHAKTGDLIQRCTSDVEMVRRFLQSQSVEIARAVFFTVVALIVMISVNITLTLITVAFLPIIFIFSYIFFKNVRRVFKMADEKEGELTTVLQESLTGIRVVRAFGRARFEVDKFTQKNNEFKDLQFKQMKYLSWYWSASDLLCFGQITLTFIVGIFLTYSGDLLAGELVMFTIFAGTMVWPIRQLGRVLSDLGRMQVAVGRIWEVLDEPAETDTEGAAPHDLRGDIVFKNVDFDYGERRIFNNISFEVKKGETIAILGATGSGKSTLMHILLRLYDYKSGSITINGKELRDISKEHLRSSVGMVLQEPFLYSKTIMGNLQMAKDDVREAEIFDATKTASAHDFIEEFEEGYNTLVGERGVTLSGGQKQRVAIARTLIKNSELLIFDDSLSAVDTETDAQIRAALSERNKDVTTFIISQRITTLMNADRIFVVEGGAIADIGTHEELTVRDGLYKRIWEIQSMLEQDFESESDY